MQSSIMNQSEEKVVSTSFLEMPEFKNLKVEKVLHHLQMLRTFDDATRIHRRHILRNAIRLVLSFIFTYSNNWLYFTCNIHGLVDSSKQLC